MALVEKRVCDVFGTTAKVMLFRIDVSQIEEADGTGIEVDLCPRAKKRLDRFIARGTTPPNSDNGKAEETP